MRRCSFYRHQRPLHIIQKKMKDLIHPLCNQDAHWDSKYVARLCLQRETKKAERFWRLMRSRVNDAHLLLCLIGMKTNILSECIRRTLDWDGPLGGCWFRISQDAYETFRITGIRHIMHQRLCSHKSLMTEPGSHYSVSSCMEPMWSGTSCSHYVTLWRDLGIIAGNTMWLETCSIEVSLLSGWSFGTRHHSAMWNSVSFCMLKATLALGS